jgi:hypothetical protein
MQPVPILQLLVQPGRGADPRSSELKAITLTITPPMPFEYCLDGIIHHTCNVP